jgi:hypothetical protein
LIAATWLVLGEKGVLQFETIRKIAIEKIRRQRPRDGVSDAGIVDDGFHDGRKVLEDISQWIELLKRHSRRNDIITTQVLALVEDKMLVDKSKRIGSKDLSKEFAELYDRVCKDQNREIRNMNISKTILEGITAVNESIKKRTFINQEICGQLQQFQPPKPSPAQPIHEAKIAFEAGEILKIPIHLSTRQSRRDGKSERLNDNIPLRNTSSHVPTIFEEFVKEKIETIEIVEQLGEAMTATDDHTGLAGIDQRSQPTSTPQAFVESPLSTEVLPSARYVGMMYPARSPPLIVSHPSEGSTPSQSPSKTPTEQPREASPITPIKENGESFKISNTQATNADPRTRTDASSQEPSSPTHHLGLSTGHVPSSHQTPPRQRSGRGYMTFPSPPGASTHSIGAQSSGQNPSPFARRDTGLSDPRVGSTPPDRVPQPFSHYNLTYDILVQRQAMEDKKHTGLVKFLNSRKKPPDEVLREFIINRDLVSSCFAMGR